MVAGGLHHLLHPLLAADIARIDAQAGGTRFGGFDGALSVGQGTLALTTANAAGATTAGISVTGGATLDLRNMALGNEAISLNNGTLAASTGTSSASGTVTLAGTDVTRAPSYERVRRGIGYVPQGREIFGRLTVDENLRMGLAYRSGSTRVPAELFELFPVL